jgi:hypothetical protein
MALAAQKGVRGACDCRHDTRRAVGESTLFGSGSAGWAIPQNEAIDETSPALSVDLSPERRRCPPHDIWLDPAILDLYSTFTFERGDA